MVDRDSPDDARSGVNIRVFPAFLQDSREVRTITSASGSPNVVGGHQYPPPDGFLHRNR